MVDASAAVVAARAISMSGPLTETTTTGSEGEESSVEASAVSEKPLSAEEYAQVALEKLFASPLFASSVNLSLGFLLFKNLISLWLQCRIRSGKKNSSVLSLAFIALTRLGCRNMERCNGNRS